MIIKLKRNEKATLKMLKPLWFKLFVIGDDFCPPNRLKVVDVMMVFRGKQLK